MTVAGDIILLIEETERDLLLLDENNNDMQDVIIPYLLVSTNFNSDVAKELKRMTGFQVNKDTESDELEDVINGLSKNDLTKLYTLIK